MKRFLQILVSLVLLVLIGMRLDLRQLLSTVREAAGLPLIWAFALGGVILVIKLGKWHSLVRRLIPDLPFKTSATSYLIGLGVGILTPGRVGEVARVAYFPKEASRLRLVGLVMVDRAFDLLVVIGLSVGGVLMVGGVWPAALVGSATVAGIAAFFLAPRFSGSIRLPERSFPFRDKLRRVASSLDLLDRATTSRCLLLSLTMNLISFVQFYILLRAFSPMAQIQVLFMVPLVVLMTVLPITFGGIGVREGTALVLFTPFLVSAEAAVSVAFLSFAINGLCPSFAGALILSRHGLDGDRFLSTMEHNSQVPPK